MASVQQAHHSAGSGQVQPSLNHQEKSLVVRGLELDLFLTLLQTPNCLERGLGGLCTL